MVPRKLSMDLLCELTTLLCTQGDWRQGPKHLCSRDVVHRSQKLEITPVSTEMVDKELCYRRTVGLSLSLEGMMFVTRFNVDELLKAL